MNRRKFLSLSAFAAGFGVVAPKLALGERVKARLFNSFPRRVGDWDIAPDGLMSRQHQSDFAVYGPEGGLAYETIRYYWRGNGRIEAVTVNPYFP
jgi:hypothetical protein